MLVILKNGQVREYKPNEKGLYHIAVPAAEAHKTLLYDLPSGVGHYSFRTLETERKAKLGVQALVGSVSRVYALDELFLGYSRDIKINHRLVVEGVVADSPVAAILETKVPEHLQPGQRFLRNNKVHRTLATWCFGSGTKVMTTNFDVFTFLEAEHVEAEKDYVNNYDRPTLVQAMRLKVGMLLQVGNQTARIQNVVCTGTGYTIISFDEPFAPLKVSHEGEIPVRCYFGCSNPPNREGWVYRDTDNAGWAFVRCPKLVLLEPKPSIQAQLDEINERIAALFKSPPKFVISKSGQPELVYGGNIISGHVTLEPKCLN